MGTIMWSRDRGTSMRLIDRTGAPRRVAVTTDGPPSTLRTGAITLGELQRQPYDASLGTVPVADGAGWRFNLPAATQTMTDYKRRLETQWLVDGKVPHYKYGSVVMAEFTVNGNLGAAAQPTTQDQWHVVSQLYGTSDNTADLWGTGFISHGVSIKQGKITWSGGGSHPGQAYTQTGTYEYAVHLDHYVDGKDYRIKVVACLADENDGWLSVWCNGVLWSKGEKWKPVGMWNGVENGNRVGVMWTKEPWNWTAMRNGIYRGTNSGEADRPKYDQSVKVTVHYLSPGTQTPAAEAAVPRYTTTFEDTFGGDLAKWTPNTGVVASSGVMSIPSQSTAKSATTVAAFAGVGSMTQAKIASLPSGDHEVTFEVQDASNPANAAQLNIHGTQIRFRCVSSSSSPAFSVSSTPFDWYRMQYVRVREQAGVWRFETSIDGWTWNERGSVSSPWSVGDVRLKVSAGRFGTGTDGTTTIDDVKSRVPEQQQIVAAARPSWDLLNPRYEVDRFAQYFPAYPTGVQDGTDYGTAPDPKGSGRPTAWYDNFRGFDTGNGYPRSGMEGPRVVKSAANGNTTDRYWFGVSFLIDDSFSQYAKDQYWLSLATAAFGPPFTTSSPLSWGVWPVGTPGKVRLVMGNAGDMILPYDYQITTGQWWTIVVRFKFAYASDGGWAQAWIGQTADGTGMAPLALKGTTGQWTTDTMGPGINDGWHLDPSKNVPNSSRLGAYSQNPSRGKVWYGHHKLAIDTGAAGQFEWASRPGPWTG